MNDDPLAKQLWKKGPGIELNAEQKDSIIRALRNKFQLIQGPPGSKSYNNVGSIVTANQSWVMGA